MRYGGYPLIKLCNASITIPTMFRPKGFLDHAVDTEIRPIQATRIRQVLNNL